MSRLGNFRVPPGVSLDAAFSELPATLRTYIREGFSVLAKLADPHRDILLASALESIAGGPDVDVEEFSQRLDVSKDSAAQLLSAATLSGWMLNTRSESAEQIVNALVDSKILDSAARNATLAYLQQVAQKGPQIRDAIKRSQLGNKILPTFESISSVVDVRVTFKGGRLDLAVPVAVVHLDTDAMNEELWFQMTKGEAEKMARQLAEIIRQLGEAEQWAGRP